MDEIVLRQSLVNEINHSNINGGDDDTDKVNIITINIIATMFIIYVPINKRNSSMSD